MASRNPKDLIPELEIIYASFKNEMDKAGEDFILTCTYRSQEEQNELWEKGRNKPGQIVTWTKKSKHTERKAFDIAILKNGKITWNIKDYFMAGEIGRKLGLDWGGSWVRSKDYPHFQYKEVG
jgi:peptidoglycan L-alanyl-D-glutamate endopeptidase CwlK